MSYIKRKLPYYKTKTLPTITEIFFYMWLIQSMKIFLKIKNKSEEFKEILTVLTGSFFFFAVTYQVKFKFS